MNIFRNINSTLLISIGISAILCGAIVYYCNMRLNHIEFAIMRQNQVLSSFITNVQNEIKGGTRLPVLSEDVSTQEARESVKQQEDNKIVVSDGEASDDNEESDDDDSSESETEDESEDEGDDKVNIDNNSLEVIDNSVEIVEVNPDESMIKQIINDNIHHIKIVDVQDLSMFINEVKFDNRSMNNHHTESTIYEIKDESSESEDESDDESEHEDVNEPEDVIEINKVKETSVVKLMNPNVKVKIEPTETATQVSTSTQLSSSETTDINSKKQVEQPPLKYEQMRVDDLRKIVLDKQLSTKEEVKKLKKQELLFLLEK